MVDIETKLPEGPICQSCSMPLIEKEDYGTNGDGSVNPEFCQHCYQSGLFIQPEITEIEMQTQVAEFMREMKMTEQIISSTMKLIPTLKRWQKNETIH